MSDDLKSVNELRQRMRRLTLDDPLLKKKAETTEEDGFVVVQVGDTLDVDNSTLDYTDHKYANPMKTSVDVTDQEELCANMPVCADQMSEHRQGLIDLCQSILSEGKSGIGQSTKV